jgi:hypothetical protein
MRAVTLMLFLIGACARTPPTAVRGAPPAAAPQHAKAGAEVMVLGVYHFANPGHDVVRADLDDHASPRRQAEIAEVVASLAAFAPTKILVEARDQAALDAAFAAPGPSPAGEIEQLGFALARRLHLPGLIAIDHQLPMDLDRLFAAANASGDQVFLAAFEAAVAHIQADTDQQPHRTVAENLRALNDPARFASDRELYLQMARVKYGDDFAGADVLAAWYQRNFRIFANLAAAVRPDDRVLVIYGQGHGAILRELIEASPALVLVEPNPYLP